MSSNVSQQETVTDLTTALGDLQNELEDVRAQKTEACTRLMRREEEIRRYEERMRASASDFSECGFGDGDAEELRLKYRAAKENLTLVRDDLRGKIEASAEALQKKEDDCALLVKILKQIPGGSELLPKGLDVSEGSAREREDVEDMEDVVEGLLARLREREEEIEELDTRVQVCVIHMR